MRSPKFFVCSAVLFFWTAFPGRLAVGQLCPPEPPIPDVDVPVVSAVEEQFLDDFGAALRRFRGMSLEEFEAEYRPAKNYLVPEGTTFVRGDATGDEKVDLNDVVCALDHLFGGGSCRRSTCDDPLDVDDSGSVSLTDPVALLNHLFVAGPPPAAPFPEAGEDPTDDALDCPSGDLLDYDPMDSQHAELIRTTLGMSEDQVDTFRRNGFVVLDNRRTDVFMHAFGDVFVKDLPVYISVDAVLDALHESFDRILEDVETHILVDQLDTMLSKLEAGLQNLRYSPEVEDVAFWTCMARSLLNGGPAPCLHGADDRVREFQEHVADETIKPVEFFGGPPFCFDFSQFKPRGHYTRSDVLTRYFKTMMWVQRVRMKFAQLERHAAVSYLLTRLLHDTSAIDEWNFINDVVEVLVGTSDSLNPPGMLELASAAGVDEVSDLYGDGFDRFVRVALQTGAGKQLINGQVLRSNPTSLDGFTPIPPAFHAMGQRFIVDSFVLTNVVWDRVCKRVCGGPPCDVVCGRLMPTALDAWFVLGNRATLPLLRSEIEVYDYHSHLAALDWIVSSYPEEFWRGNLYHVWISALRALNRDTTTDRYPEVMRTKQWDRRILNTQLASWAHLRHDTVLYAKPSYTTFGCDYPDGWVDPYPEFFERLAAFAETALERFEGSEVLDLDVRGYRVGAYYENLRSSSRMLASIAQAELDQERLSEEQFVFIKSLFKDFKQAYGFEVNGWYRDLLYHGFETTQEGNFFQFSPTVVDIHTDPNPPGQVLHAGVGFPNLMVISVDNDCGNRAYVGPVLSYYEFVTQGLRRVTDEEWAVQLIGQWEGELGTRPDPDQIDRMNLFFDEQVERPVDGVIHRPDWAYEFVR